MLPIWGMVDWLFCFELSTNLPWSHPSDRCHSIPSQHHLCILQGFVVEMDISSTMTHWAMLI